MANKQFPEWAILLYRGVRPAIASGIAQTILLSPNWADWQNSWRNIVVVFLSGFLPAFGKWLREFLDDQFGYDEKSLIQKVFPI